MFLAPQRPLELKVKTFYHPLQLLLVIIFLMHTRRVQFLLLHARGRYGKVAFHIESFVWTGQVLKSNNLERK